MFKLFQNVIRLLGKLSVTPVTLFTPTVVLFEKGVNKVTGVTESFPSNLNTFWKSLNILHLSYLDG